MYKGEIMTEQVEKQEAPQPAADSGTELNINDLNAMKLIIDVASSRGAFKPAEMTLVGQTYTKLSTFLDAVAKQSEKQPASNTGV
jgi:hypothetical protein